ncbi:MAG: hypothetical protein IJS38_00105 [Erysipelotrichaceae bacterium]|nr:hypothetical protein [Erysipelotrichaceae bacterium]
MSRPLIGKHAVPGSKMLRTSNRINMATEEGFDISELLERYDLTVRYQYHSGPIYSLSPARTLSFRQLRELAENLRQEAGVRSVSLDGINEMHVSSFKRTETR